MALIHKYDHAALEGQPCYNPQCNGMVHLPLVSRTLIYMVLIAVILVMIGVWYYRRSSMDAFWNEYAHAVKVPRDDFTDGFVSNGWHYDSGVLYPPGDGPSD